MCVCVCMGSVCVCECGCVPMCAMCVDLCQSVILYSLRYCFALLHSQRENINLFTNVLIIYTALQCSTFSAKWHWFWKSILSAINNRNEFEALAANAMASGPLGPIWTHLDHPEHPTSCPRTVSAQNITQFSPNTILYYSFDRKSFDWEQWRTVFFKTRCFTFELLFQSDILFCLYQRKERKFFCSAHLVVDQRIGWWVSVGSFACFG